MAGRDWVGVGFRPTVLGAANCGRSDGDGLAASQGTDCAQGKWGEDTLKGSP